MPASMRSLSPELVAHIASFLEREEDQSHIPLFLRQRFDSKLPPYACISRQWQYAIERRTFQSLQLKSTDLAYFTNIVVAHRRRFLTSLKYEIILPSYSDSACARFEREVDQTANSEAFTAAIHGLFKSLKSWEGDSSGRTKDAQSIALSLAVYSPMDRHHRGAEKYKEDQKQCDLRQRSDLWELRYEHSYLQLLDTPELPTLASITALYARLSHPRSVEPRAIALLAAKLPNLRNIDWALKDNEKKDPELAQKLHHEFAQELFHLSRQPFQEIRLEMYHEAPMNHDFSPPSILLPSSSTTDHLSQTLHTLSQVPTLTYLHLSGPMLLSDSLFWPTSPPSSVSPPPSWPTLKTLIIDLNTVTPTGSWYFDRDPSAPAPADDNEDDDDEPVSDASSDTDEPDPFSDDEADSPPPDHRHPNRLARLIGDKPVRLYRTLPAPPLNPFLLAMARAAGQMPALERMTLEADVLGSSQHGVFQVEFLGRGLKSQFDEVGESETERIIWCVGAWRPEEAVEKVWREGRGEGLGWRFVEW